MVGSSPFFSPMMGAEAPVGLDGVQQVDAGGAGGVGIEFLVADIVLIVPVPGHSSILLVCYCHALFASVLGDAEKVSAVGLVSRWRCVDVECEHLNLLFEPVWIVDRKRIVNS